MKFQNWKTRWLLCLAAIPAAGALAASGTISTTLSPAGTVPLGSTFTVTLSISGYPGLTEIDGYNFRVTYPAGLFSLVGGSLDMHDNSSFGATENWLRKPPQDFVGAGALPLDDYTLSGAGLLSISVADLRLSSIRGTTDGSRFLYSFNLMANALGTGSITPAAALDGSVLFDVSLSPAGVPAFSGASITVVAAVNTTRPTLTNSVSSGNLNLSWPTDHIGFRLEAQTNALSVGLHTNWVTWPGSSTTNAISIPLDAANPTVFFRLIYP